MLPTTIDAVNAILRADPTVTAADRTAILAIVRSHGRAGAGAKAGEMRLIRRDDVAKMLARTTRSVDHLASQGVLRRVKLPGRNRGCGFVAAEVERLLMAEAETETEGRIGKGPSTEPRKQQENRGFPRREEA